MSGEVTLLVAFGAGLLSFASPCVLPLVPIYLAHLAGTYETGEKRGRGGVFPYALSFVSGFSLVFIVFGASIGFVGYILRDQLPILQKVSGVFLVIFGLHLVGILRIPWLDRTWRPATAGGSTVSLARSFAIGAAFATGWTPCIGVILGSILALAATSETALAGAALLGVYSLGLAIPFLAAALALDWWTKAIRGFSRHLPKVEMASGLLIIAVGILVFTGRLSVLNRYFDFFGLGAGI
ncbi:MAG: cytochrome c biosis protein, transrane region [Dehalococcoidia bacterium]|nr:cytochrome c biosis protein, transrane region [Dehalococcoidia bacterium]